MPPGGVVYGVLESADISTSAPPAEGHATDEPPDGALHQPATAPAASASRRFAIITYLVVGLLLAGGYVLFERAGTRANVEAIDYHQRFGGGFLAVARTSTQPGFLALSLLDRSKVDIDAVMRSNWATGKSTVVTVATPGGKHRHRLRGPVALLIGPDGGVTTAPLPWTLADFQACSKAVDCSVVDWRNPKPCGQPFEDVRRWLTRSEDVSASPALDAFLQTAADPQTAQLDADSTR